MADGTPMNSIDIDVGGTFTDLVLTMDGERIIANVRPRRTISRLLHECSGGGRRRSPA